MSAAQLAKRLARLLAACELRVVFAESCTAGLVSATLSRVPGISNWHCGSAVTYRNATKAGWLGVSEQDLEHPGAVSETVARQMALGVLRNTPEADLSVSITGHLGPDAPPRLDGRVFVGLARRESGDAVTALEVLETKLKASTRVSRQKEAIVLVLAQLESQLEVEQRNLNHVLPAEDWSDVREGAVDAVCVGEAEEDGRHTSGLIFPGAFNPMHDGHRRMAEIASQLVGATTEFELSIANVDKPPLRRYTATHRAQQLLPHGPVWITNTPTFAEKALLFPGATFIVGADTMLRIADPRYYRGDAAARDRCIEALGEQGCRFLLFGRTIDEVFCTVDSMQLPPALSSICDEVPPERFRVDVCSTDLRDRSNPRN
jgi:PncC family amidohydrolase